MWTSLSALLPFKVLTLGKRSLKSQWNNTGSLKEKRCPYKFSFRPLYELGAWSSCTPLGVTEIAHNVTKRLCKGESSARRLCRCDGRPSTIPWQNSSRLNEALCRTALRNVYKNLNAIRVNDHIMTARYWGGVFLEKYLGIKSLADLEYYRQGFNFCL